MVITNSDSTGTLVSLDNSGLKRIASLKSFPVQSCPLDFRRTNLQLPEEDKEGGWDLDDSPFHYSETKQLLYLPAKETSIRVDEVLKCVPVLMDSRDDLLAQPPIDLTASSKERILYVTQGEIAHCSVSQCDILVSDRATTCHILAFRSSSASKTAEVLCTLTHLDGTSYTSCIRAALDSHRAHHGIENINIDVHIVGGFDDVSGSSQEISNWLLHLLADLSDDYCDMSFTLKTVAVTAMNDDFGSAPIGRGLAINTRCGSVFLAKCSAEVTGPATQLRSARLWTKAGSSQLHLIHTQYSDVIELQPFKFGAFEGIGSLLKMRDHALLHCTSTSPGCEENDFCTNVRKTLIFLRDTACQDIFGLHLDRKLTFTRQANSNHWA